MVSSNGVRMIGLLHSERDKCNQSTARSETVKNGGETWSSSSSPPTKLQQSHAKWTCPSNTTMNMTNPLAGTHTHAQERITQIAIAAAAFRLVVVVVVVVYFCLCSWLGLCTSLGFTSQDAAKKHAEAVCSSKVWLDCGSCSCTHLGKRETEVVVTYSSQR